MSARTDTAVGLEALRQLAAEGGAEAARALGRLTGCEASLGAVRAAPAPDSAELAALADGGSGEVVAVGMDLEGPVAGRLVVVLPADEAERLATALAPASPAGTLDALGESALVEAGNIAGSAFVSALARRLGGRLLHRVPRLTRGTARTCLDLLNGRPAGPALAARFRCHGRLGVGGVLVFLPDASLAAALETR